MPGGIGSEEQRVKFACLCHRSELWAEHGKCEKRICRKSNSNGEQCRERRGRGGERTKAAMNEKSAWRMQFWKCPRRVELTNWLNEWLDCLDFSDCRLPTVDCWLLTADWWLVKRLTAPLTVWAVSAATAQLVKLMFAYQKITQQLQKNTLQIVRYNIEFGEIRYKCCHNTILLVLYVLCTFDNNV